MTPQISTDVLIVGGGPSGLMLAIELGCRGIACVVIEEDLGPPQLPKANATSARTMEHYRRRGFADQIRALGLPAGHAQDVTYHTRLVGDELARFQIPSSDRAAAQQSFGDYGEDAWPTPELPHRAQQMYIEPILAKKAASYPSVKVKFGMRASALQQSDDGVTVEINALESGASMQAQARYVVGCDGPRSLVRHAMKVGYSGQGSERREFFGGQMVSVYFRSANLYSVIGKPKAWQYWVVNAKQRGLLVAVNGIDTFVALVQLKDGQTLVDLDADKALLDVVGAQFAYDIIACTPWSAGFALVADRFQNGRLLIAGDAAHLFTPTGGMGYNTSVDDAVNLGWKLAAVVQGWAPPDLLHSYEAERKPMALRNTTFARHMADSIGRIAVPPEIEDAGYKGEAARSALGQALASHVAREFNIPGLQLGVRYVSNIVASDVGKAPPDDANVYVPSSYPGARAPHVRLGKDSLLDHFGRDFTLLALCDADTRCWQEAASGVGVPLTILRINEPAVRMLYDCDLILIRPDHHIAWRGGTAAEPRAVLSRATGHAQKAHRDDSKSATETLHQPN
jgi:2-polyprenyl-6-methoxyphenol hydroxylase-like FAD-dependent oxidoreductase